MRKVQVKDIVLRLHFKAHPSNIDKAIQILTDFLDGKIYAKRLGCGHFRVIEVNRNERIVINNSTFNYMTHEQYNNYIARR